MFDKITKILEYGKENNLSEEETTILLSCFLDYEIDLMGNGWFDELTEEQKEEIDDKFELVNSIIST
jgi:hypothetical protein